MIMKNTPLFLFLSGALFCQENSMKQEVRPVDSVKKNAQIEEIVISGTMKEVRKQDSPIPIDVFSSKYFERNRSNNIFEALSMVNGVRPQLNCNVCYTGDIRINGLDGAYTQVLIDGMPIVSSLGTVYGLSGIPNSLIERVEVVKGAASTLYGSEAVAGLINIITKNAHNAPKVGVDGFTTSWGEHNWDVGLVKKWNNTASTLLGINMFHFNNIVDNNEDKFTDVPLQSRVSVFNKWNIHRKSNKQMSFAMRYLYEDRWGGQTNWTPAFRGTDERYAESIYTNRAELFGVYQLPTEEKLFLDVSGVYHHQDSRYGDTPYIATQNIGFAQLRWDKKINRHDFVLGSSLRYTYYDDNTAATENEKGNHPDKFWLPGVFIQDVYQLAPKHKLLLGMRYDHHSKHGNIFTPRFAYHTNITPATVFRANFGTGFRVVNLFSEDHAALTGAREVIIREELKPEKSYNGNINFTHKFFQDNGTIWNIDFSAFYSHFKNRIIPDYDTHPNQIIYSNLDGYGESRGLSLNTDVNFPNLLKIRLGATLLDSFLKEDGVKRTPEFTERFSAVWSVSYPIKPIHLTVDYSGNLYAPMNLPLAGELDPRPEKSPWYSIQNIQLTFSGLKNIQIYGGVKNFLNWTPWKNIPFLISRAHDPFDKEVLFDADGRAIPTPDNPYGLTFDPSYSYAPNQGIRFFLGLKFSLK